MRRDYLKTTIKTAILAVTVLLLVAGVASAQTTVNLTAGRTSTTLPDGKVVPMWGYSCDATSTLGACRSLNATAGTGWSPILITVPSGSGLTINLTNNLPTATSLVITGQINGGGLGSPYKVASPAHDVLLVTTSAVPILSASESGTTVTIVTASAHGLSAQMPVNISGVGAGFDGNVIVASTPSTSTFTYTSAANIPSPTVTATAAATPLAAQTSATWPIGSPGSFTPPVQSSRAQSFVSEDGAGGSQTYTWGSLKPGTYLIMSGTHPSIQEPMGLYGVLVVTQAPTTTAGVAYPNISYDADAVALLSEIDPVQNAAVDAVATAGALPANENTTWTAACGAAHTCYPPAVNYTPLYYLINGQSFNKSAPGNSALTIPATASGANGVLVRFVNAGLRMHVPSVVGLDMSLIAEDGNVLPDVALAAGAAKPLTVRVQSEVFLAAGKVYDAIVKPPQTIAGGPYNAASYPVFDRELSLSSNNQPDGGMQAVLLVGGATANAPTVTCNGVAATACAVNDAFAVSPGQSVSGNVLSNDINVVNAALVGPGPVGLTFNPDGTFTYVAPSTAQTVTFTYNGNTNTTNIATVTITVVGRVTPTAVADAYPTSSAPTSTASTLKISRGLGVLANDISPNNYPLTAVFESAQGGLKVNLNSDGSFTAAAPTPCPSTVTGCVYVFSYHNVNSQGTPSSSANVTLTFMGGSGLQVTVRDAQDPTATGVISDYSWVIEEDDTIHTPAGKSTPPPAKTLSTSFHRAHMPVIASGCTGVNSCGDGQTVMNVPVAPQSRMTPDQVVLDPLKYHYISVLPGDAANPFAGVGTGHTMGGAAILPACPPPATTCTATFAPVTVLAEPSPLPTSSLSVFVFEDNNPTNGDIDGPEQQQGLGGFQIILNDVAGASGDKTGQMTYDMFNMPLTNSLAGRKDTVTGADLCPITADPSGLMGMIITCPEKDSLGNPSPLAGHAVIKNLFPNRFDVLANPGATREAAGETWIQTSTLEGTRGQDAFAKNGEPGYFQEFGPPGPHSFIGFVNPAHIKQVNAALKGTNTIIGKVTMLHMTRPANEMLYDSGSYDTLAQTHCYVSLNSANGTGPNIAFAECNADGSFRLTGVPVGTYQLAVSDQWLDQIMEYKTVTVPVGSTGATIDVRDVPVFSWFTRVETSTYMDLNQNGVRDPGEPGISQIPTRIRFRDGSVSQFIPTDTDGYSPFDELFPLFNWYVVESDTTRFKGTGVHIAVDGGGPVASDPLYPGVLNSTYPTGGSTVRTDPGTTLTEGIQSFVSQSILMDWGKTPYAAGENGGLLGHVIYASTRPFDDPNLGFQNTWEPLVPNVKVNLYLETTAPDGTQGLTLLDTTTTSSWDDYVNGTHLVNGAAVQNMQCPGQITTDPFFTYTLGTANQMKCYDGFHNWNQAQPAPYDGQYQFPTANCTSSTAATGAPANGCIANPTNATAKMLPPGKYVVEVVVPAGYEIVKEEDKNILIGDSYIAPLTQQFGAMGNIFILPDQAAVNAYYNAYNPNNATTNLGRTSFANFGPGGAGIANTPCVGQLRIVPDYMSLFPGAKEVAPFAGASRRLCDRREVTLDDQMQAGAEFLIFTPTPIASHFTGMILDDASSEFNTAAPDFGEKFAVPFVPVSFRDFNGVEISRSYSDQFGMFNGLVYSTWAVNPPNPTGYAPNMMVTCMNDPGPIVDTRPGSTTLGQLIPDPMYNPMYSNFCYTNPFMPGVTDYMDTPVLPVAAFASGYNPPDCAYPDATPAIKYVNWPGDGPYVPATGGTLVITALGDVDVPNNAYIGPSGNPAALTGQKMIKRHYGFGDPQGNNQGNNQCPGTVTLNGISLAINSWSDTSITAAVPAGATTGELVITACNGKRSVDTITVTVGGNAPKHVTAPAQNLATGAGLPHPIQDAIDAANPGDLILLEPGTYPELVVMWKPVRLQGVGAASVIINAAKYPTQKLEGWRTKINGLFGLDAQGNPLPGVVPQADPLPGQEITGGITVLEPSVLGTEEGSGIAVTAKNYPDGSPANCGTTGPVASNFYCAPSRIDGISVTGGDSGGGIYVNGWAHNLEVSNNRIYGNAGTFSGGVRIGQPYLESQALAAGGNQYLGFGYNKNVKIHNNKITSNGTVEANNGQAGGGAGVSMCSGADNYVVNFNFICGNFSLGDGGGVGHVGVSLNGNISNNWILFNQVFNQSSNTSGGGIVIEGEPSLLGGLSLGAGNVTVDSNLIQGNNAAAGHGGGVRLQYVNGADVQLNPYLSGMWWQVSLTNNMIVDNVAGWSGGGISLLDTLNSRILFNTVTSNDSTATVGAVFTTSPTQSSFQPAGISSELNSPVLCTALAGASLAFRCTGNAGKPFSQPYLSSNIIYHNRSFYFTAGATNPNTGLTTTALVPTLPAQTTAGQCTGTPNYWDLGVVGQAQTNQTMFLHAQFSILSSLTQGNGYNTSLGASAHNSASDPRHVKTYCNGSRVNPGIPDTTPSAPPVQFTMAAAATEDEGGNWIDVHYGPLSLTDSAIAAGAAGYGNPVGDYRICAGAGNPAGCTGASPAIDTASSELAPNHDFFGTTRPQGDFDRGAHEVVKACTGGACSGISVTPLFVDFGAQQIGSVTTQTITVTSNGATPLTGIVIGQPGGANAGQFTRAHNCPGTLAPGASCTITVSFRPFNGAGGLGTKTATLNVTSSDADNSPVQVTLSGYGQAPSGTVLPTPLAFGSQLVNTITVTAAQPVTVTNTGVGPLLIANIFINGLNANQFNLTNVNCPIGGLGIPVGGTCTINVNFRPTSLTPANKNATLTVRFASAQTLPSQVQTVSLTGTATAAAVTQAPLAFGTAPPADTTLTAQVNNNAASGNLTITSVTITAGGTYFTIAPTTTCTPGAIVAATNSCDVNVTFTRTPPNSTAVRTGNLRIVTPSGTFNVPLSGN